MDDRKPAFFLASSDGYVLEQPRECCPVQALTLGSGRDVLLVRIRPPLLYVSPEGESWNFDELLLVNKHLGDSVTDIREWPFSVYVARLLYGEPPEDGRLKEDQLAVIAWAELYPDQDSACSGIV